MLLRLEAVSRSIATRTLFRDVDLSVSAGDRVGLVGPNGAGKTTLLRIAAGLDAPDSGRVLLPRGVRRGLLRQEIDPATPTSVRAEASTALAHLDALAADLKQAEAGIAAAGRAGREVPVELAERYDRARVAFEFGGGFERDARVDRVLAGLGFDGAAAARPLSSFSGGWLMRVELAKLLLAAPDVLLLDEPTNHLDIPSIEWFEGVLAEFGGAVVMISHDRAFLRRHVSRVAELEGGCFSVYTGSWDRYLEQKRERREQAEAAARNQDRRVAETERFVERFRYKASKARQVQSRIKSLERMQRVERPEEVQRRPRLRIPKPSRAGDPVLRMTGIHKSYGDHTVYDGIDFQVRRGERIALVGPNGAGKSTLLRLAAGVIPADAGERRVGHNVTVGFYAQHQLESLDSGRSVLAELEAVARTEDVPRLRGHLGAFLFSGDDVEKRVSVLSGGEKARLALARMLLRPVNFLVLDEPTNHLDVAACEVLEQALAGYEGTLLFISHDRAFIDAVASKVVEVRNGRLEEHAGNYAAWRAGEAGPVSGATAAAPDAAAAKQERIAAREQAKQRDRELARSRRRFEALEQEIASRETQLEALGLRLADPEIYCDGDAVRGLEAERAELGERLERDYAEWESLAAVLEESAASPD